MQKRNCVQCGKEFVLQDSEIEFYNSKNLNLPKRCKECRTKNKSNGDVKDTTKGQNTRNYQNRSYENRNSQNKSYQNKSDPKNSNNAKGENDFAGNQVKKVEQPNYATSEKKNSMNDNRTKKNRWIAPISAVVLLLALVFGVGEQFSQSDWFKGRVQNEDNFEKETIVDSEFLYQFRNETYLQQHFQKHGSEFPYGSQEEYLAGANRVIQDVNTLHKIEKEDGDDVYYLEESNEYVVVSTDGYIRTYFKPSDGIDYFERQ